MSKKTTLIILATVIVLGVVIAGAYLLQTESSIPVRTEDDQKIVYTIDLSVDEERLRLDCSERGGKFNECGSPCGPDEDVCMAVCAYTCEFNDN